MPYNTQFQMLSATHRGTLSDPNNLDSKRIYIDCLGMLHDVLLSFDANPEHSVFEWFGQSIVRAKVETHLNMLRGLGGVDDIGYRNVEIAFDLRQQFLSASPGIPTYLITYFADRYLDALLTEYGAIRR